MNSLENMLKSADFSKETDLKDRLYARLFSARTVQFPGRRLIVDEDVLGMVNAAGDQTPSNPLLPNDENHP